jgi:hypothetical protein
LEADASPILPSVALPTLPNKTPDRFNPSGALFADELRPAHAL